MSAAIPERLGYGRKQRIKTGRDFSRVKQGGERLATGCLIANWLRLPQVQNPGAALLLRQDWVTRFFEIARGGC